MPPKFGELPISDIPLFVKTFRQQHRSSPSSEVPHRYKSNTAATMSGLLGKLAGQLASGSGGGGSSSGSNNTQSRSGKLLHSVTDKVTGQSHPQDRAGSSQQSYYPQGAPAPYGNQAQSHQQSGREQQHQGAYPYQQGHGGHDGNPHAQDYRAAGSDAHAGQRPYTSNYPQANEGYAPSLHAGYQEGGVHGQQVSGHGYEREGHAQGEGYGRYEQGQYGREQNHGGYQQGPGGYGKGHETQNQGHGKPRQGYGGH